MRVHPETGAIICEDGVHRPAWAAAQTPERDYYDNEWGNTVHDERGLFERISLEAFQAGLSWATILRKREAFREAFDQFQPDTVAGYSEKDVTRLLNNAGIVRNEAKIRATIANAQATVALREHPVWGAGGLDGLIWSFQRQPSIHPQHIDDIPSSTPESIALAKTLKTLGFRFVGPTTVCALMLAIGVIPGHLPDSAKS